MTDVRERADAPDVRCPWCHASLGTEERIACPVCSTEHHAGCAGEARRCTTMGCAGVLVGAVDPLDERLARAARERTQPLVVPPPARDRLHLPTLGCGVLVVLTLSSAWLFGGADGLGWAIALGGFAISHSWRAVR